MRSERVFCLPGRAQLSSARRWLEEGSRLQQQLPRDPVFRWCATGPWKMSKALVLVLAGLLVTAVLARNTQQSSRGAARVQAQNSRCGKHGDTCVSDSDCCQSIKCHRYANRCQVQISMDELMAQREKILGRRGPDN